MVGALSLAAILAIYALFIIMAVVVLRGGRLRRARVYRVAPGLIVIEELRNDH